MIIHISIEQIWKKHKDQFIIISLKLNLKMCKWIKLMKGKNLHKDLKHKTFKYVHSY
jgi:hypothetical protein